MVTYSLGNIGAKRRAYRAAANETTLSIDNDEVVADFLLDGKVFFVIGETPCGNLTVAQYIAYARSLKTRLPANNRSIRELLRRVGCTANLSCRMRSLSQLNYRKVQLAASLETSTKALFLNFDGVAFSPVRAAKVRRFVRRMGKLFDVHAGVSDFRFVPKRAECEVYLPDGRKRGTVPQRGKKVARAKLKWALSRHGMTFCWKHVKQVVLCDN